MQTETARVSTVNVIITTTSITFTSITSHPSFRPSVTASLCLCRSGPGAPHPTAYKHSRLLFPFFSPPPHSLYNHSSYTLITHTFFETRLFSPLKMKLSFLLGAAFAALVIAAPGLTREARSDALVARDPKNCNECSRAFAN